MGPTNKLKAATGGLVGRVKDGMGGFGMTLKKTVSGGNDGRGGSKVNLDRGNSQFLEQVPQHSRSNSTVSGYVQPLTVKDRLSDLVEGFKDNVLYRLRPRKEKYKDSVDPFAAAREKQLAKTGGQPDFSILVAMEEQELQQAAERRRMSLSGGTTDTFGSLGLNFSSSLDPNNEKNPFADPPPLINPFADSVAQPKPSIPKGVSSTYVDTIRRSRGQSISLTGNPLTQTSDSRYPSTIGASTIGNRDTYRDTYMSSATRKTRARSDPFDLELLGNTGPVPALPTPNRGTANSGSYFSNADFRASANTRQSSLRGQPIGNAPLDSNGAQPRAVSVFKPRVISSTGTYSSRYSGDTNMGGWGDPGPDLGPGSATLRPGLLKMDSVMTGYSSLVPMPLFGEKEQEAENERDQIRDDVSVGSGKSSGRGIGKAR